MRWLLALLLLMGTALAQSSQPSASSNTPTAQTAQPPAADQRGTDKVPLTIKILPAPDAKEQAEKAERESHEKAIIDKKLAFETQRIADYTDRLAWFTLTLFCAAIGQIALFWVQLRYMRVGTKDTGIAANAAQTSADIARLSMVAGDRAYVHHNGCRWISHRDTRDGNIFWRIRPRWVNSGNTPTRRLDVRIQYELLDKAIDDKYPFFIDPKTVPIPATIPPKGEIESNHFDISGTDLIAVRDGKKYFYVWGVARYRDVFPSTSEHVTKFCVVVMGMTGDPKKAWDTKTNPLDILFRTYDRHNCADEDCGPTQ
jgi:hypothetical protein